MLTRKSFRSRAISSFVALMLSGAALAESAMTLDVPAGDLVSALQVVAKQSGVNLVFAADEMKGIRTEGVRGNLTAREAVEKLLKGTALKLSTDAQTGAMMIGRRERPTAGLGRKDSETIRLAQADAGSNARAEESTDAVQLEEIVVTAQKKEERLLDTPLSVSVLSADTLTRSGASQFRDFADNVPGLSFSTSGAGNTQIALRGVTTGFDVGPTVGVYVDEVPYGSSTPFALDAQFRLDAALFDLDRIEVLRGPQGTLYGASALGGLIKYVTRTPDPNRFDGAVQAGLSTMKDGGTGYNVAGVVNVPLASNRAALRASAFEYHDGGFIDNALRDAKDVDESDVYGGRLDLLVTPSDALSVRFNLFAQNISRDGEATADYDFTGAKPYGKRSQSRYFAEPFDQHFRLGSATVTYDFGPAKLTSVSSYQTTDTDYFADVSFNYVPLLNFFGFGPYSAVGVTNPLSTDKFTQEIRLASSTADQPLEWLVGAFYTHEKSTNVQRFVLRDVAGDPSPNILYDVSRPSKYREYAVFGDLTWHLSDRFDVTGGLRHARNKQDFRQIDAGFLLPPTPAPTSSDENVNTYLLNARYRFSDHATGYLRYATGYRPGGPNVVTSAGGPASFEADRLKSYEAGIKAESADRRFGMDLSGYYIDWSNVQVLVIRGGFGTYDNAAGGARIVGSELELTARPTAGLKLTASAAYQNAKMSDAEVNLGAADGERLPNVPRLAATVNANYGFTNGNLQPTVGATFRYVGDRDASFDNGATVGYPQFHLPHYSTVDLRAGMTFGAVETQVYVRNLFDELGVQSLILPQFGPRISVLPPRTFGVSATMRF